MVGCDSSKVETWVRFPVPAHHIAQGSLDEGLWWVTVFAKFVESNRRESQVNTCFSEEEGNDSRECWTP